MILYLVVAIKIVCSFLIMFTYNEGANNGFDASTIITLALLFFIVFVPIKNL
jgi:hypothetical protein